MVDKCVLCSRLIEDLRDDASRKEASISGWCQDCQDGYFGVEQPVEKVAARPWEEWTCSDCGKTNADKNGGDVEEHYAQDAYAGRYCDGCWKRAPFLNKDEDMVGSGDEDADEYYRQNKYEAEDYRHGSKSPHVSVRDYGAKQDGVTDDTAAFQAAYDALPEVAVNDLYGYLDKEAAVEEFPANEEPEQSESAASTLPDWIKDSFAEEA